MPEVIQLGSIPVDVNFKAIKNLHLSVLPPEGKVRVSAPLNMKLEIIRIYLISKLGWIQREQRKFRTQDRETPREFIPRESHYLWGKRFLMRIIEADEAPSVSLSPKHLNLTIRPGTIESRRSEIVEEWYRQNLRTKAIELITQWEAILGVKSGQLFIQKMKTKWGACSPESGNIRLNTELAKKPVECLEYIIVHELVHLIEPSHNSRFQSLMSSHLPHWRNRKDLLNSLPVKQESWQY